MEAGEPGPWAARIFLKVGSAHINAALLQVLDGSGSGVNTDDPCKPGRDGFGDFIVTVEGRRAHLVGVGETRYARWGKINDVTEHCCVSRHSGTGPLQQQRL